MKIMHVTKKYPSALGGDSIVVSNLQKEQQIAGHKVVIVTSNCDEITNGENIYKVGLKDTPAGLDKITFRRIVSLIMLFFRMFPILSKELPDVIHTHSVDMAFFVSFAARFYKIPIIHTFHIVTFYDAGQSPLRRKTEMWLAKKAKLHSVTAPNNFDVKKLRAAGLTQALLLSNGVDVDFWKKNTQAKQNKTFEFFTVGRLEHQKGHEYLIKAAALLARTQSEAFHITIVGEGSQKTALKELVRSLNIDDKISFVGAKNQDEIRKLLYVSDAAIYPSLYETTPLTLLEAWSASVPVIVTSVGIVRDAPSDFGAAYIVPSKDEQALMEAMLQCLTDRASTIAMAAKGHLEAKKYAWPVIAESAEAIYRSTW